MAVRTVNTQRKVQMDTYNIKVDKAFFVQEKKVDLLRVNYIFLVSTQNG